MVDLQRRAGGAGAGVVDEPVEAPVALQHRRRPGARGRPRRVTSQATCPRRAARRAARRGGRRGARRAPGWRRRRQRDGELLAEARARAGHDDDATVQCMGWTCPRFNVHLKSVQFSIHRRTASRYRLKRELASVSRAEPLISFTRLQLRNETPCRNHASRRPPPQPPRPVVTQQARGDPRGRDRPVRPRGLRAQQVGRRGGGRRHRLDGAVSLLRVQAPLPLRDHGRGAARPIARSSSGSPRSTTTS